MKDLSMDGDLIVRWTARLAVLCYVARLYCETDRRPSVSSRYAARWCWTIGCLWFTLHVVAAFHFIHHWSHSHTIESTARRTAEMTGWNSGVGLYVNEMFLFLWITDTILWWHDLSWTNNRGIYWGIQSIFAFLMFQATVVFGPPFWKPVGFLLIVMILGRVFKLRERWR